jgi:hypothetical protein
MKMNLSLNFDEGMAVVDALRDCAIEQGWDENELEDSGVIEEYSKAVDAALKAMGINVYVDTELDDDDDADDDEDSIEGYEDEDEDEDEEMDVDEFRSQLECLVKEDEDGNRGIPESVAREVVEIIKSTVDSYEGLDSETRREIFMESWKSFCEALDIQVVFQGE